MGFPVHPVSRRGKGSIEWTAASSGNHWDPPIVAYNRYRAENQIKPQILSMKEIKIVIEHWLVAITTSPSSSSD